MAYNETAFNELVDGIAVIGELTPVAANGTPIWVLFCGFLVFFMHAGFTMLESGSVRHRNAVNIMYKNIGTITIGAIMYFIFGYAFAYGTDNASLTEKTSYKFIGTGNYLLVDEDPDNSGRHSWFFQMAFAATAATIVSGAVAGRVALPAYFGLAAYLTAFVYPVVSHWIWATGGWLSAFQDDEEVSFDIRPFAEDGGCGVIDYAGSGVVHLTGGAAALVVAAILGPRLGRFTEDPAEFAPHNMTLCTLGTFILWFGWYGFNCGSTLAWDGGNASKVAVTTTLAPAGAVLTGMTVHRLLTGSYDLPNALNCALAGLVSITAGCSTLPDGYALLAGMIGSLVYMGSSKLMKLLKIDDVVDAFSVHGAAGVWGLLAVGIFADPEDIYRAYSSLECDGAGGVQIQTQLLAAAAIIGWVVLTVAPVAIVLKVTGKLRVSEEEELAGLDSSEHGGSIAFIPSDDKDL